jgi:hypothetical protein
MVPQWNHFALIQKERLFEYLAGWTQPGKVFDHVQPADIDEDCARLPSCSDRLASAGEPLFSSFTSDGIFQQLRAVGFADFEDHTRPGRHRLIPWPITGLGGGTRLALCT